jgi:hypothetical protein
MAFFFENDGRVRFGDMPEPGQKPLRQASTQTSLPTLSTRCGDKTLLDKLA